MEEFTCSAATRKTYNSRATIKTDFIWDRAQYPITSWKQDHILKTGIQNSVVWYFQELARRVGREKMQKYVHAVGYGNENLTGKIDKFCWFVVYIEAKDNVFCLATNIASAAEDAHGLKAKEISPEIFKKLWPVAVIPDAIAWYCNTMDIEKATITLY